VINIADSAVLLALMWVLSGIDSAVDARINTASHSMGNRSGLGYDYFWRASTCVASSSRNTGIIDQQGKNSLLNTSTAAVP
jgi:hypothetical protein